MSKKHNVRKSGSRSRYPERLAARGISSSSVRMPFLDRRGRKHDSMEQMLRGERSTADRDDRDG